MQITADRLNSFQIWMVYMSLQRTSSRLFISINGFVVLVIELTRVFFPSSKQKWVKEKVYPPTPEAQEKGIHNDLCISSHPYLPSTLSHKVFGVWMEEIFLYGVCRLEKMCCPILCMFTQGKSRWDAGTSVLQMEITVTGGGGLWVLQCVCIGLPPKFLSARNIWYGKENILFTDLWMNEFHQ